MAGDTPRKAEEPKYKPHLRVSPASVLTHHELILDFLDGEPNRDFVIRIDGPIAQPYYATLKTDPQGNAQLIWRTPEAGDYDISVETVGLQSGWEGDFEVLEQSGLGALTDRRNRHDPKDSDGDGANDEGGGAVMSVEPPSLMEPDNKDTLSQESLVARGEEDPEVLGEVDEKFADRAGETEEGIEGVTVNEADAQAQADQTGEPDQRDVKPSEEAAPPKSKRGARKATAKKTAPKRKES